MNYYELWIGDYAAKTAHLRLVDHGTYQVILGFQYATERGLPCAYESLYVIAKAMTDEERASVRRVVDEFFPVGDDGLRWNPRAYKEIAKYQRRSTSSRENGKRGGRPPGKNLTETQPVTQQEPNREPNPEPRRNLDESSPTPTPYKDQTPLTPLLTQAGAGAASAARPRADRVPDDPPGFAKFWSTYPPRRKTDKAKCLDLWKRGKLETAAFAIVRHVEGMKRHPDWTKEEGEYVPAPLRYLRGRRWEDGAPSAGGPDLFVAPGPKKAAL